MMICPQCRKMDLEIRAAKLSPCLFSTCWTCIEAQWARKFAHIWISEKYIRLGKLLSGTDERSDADYAFYVANYIESLVEELKIPTLCSYDLSEEELTAIVRTTDHKNNPVVFTPEELKDMLMTRL